MFVPVEQRDCEVDVELHAVAGAAPDEVHPQGLVVAREPEGPPVVAVAEGISYVIIFRPHLPLQIVLCPFFALFLLS